MKKIKKLLRQCGLLSLLFFNLLLCTGQTFSPEKSRIEEAKKFCREKGMNQQWAVLVDMGIHPGRYRCFLTDLNTGEVLAKSICCHGLGKNSTVLKPDYSNQPGSNCTSLGKYRIGDRGYSQYGIHVHYKLHGLEPSNNNALKRIVVLHSYSPVPFSEIYPGTPPLGWSLGCPVISDSLMTTLDRKLRGQSGKILLWIYDSSQKPL